MAETTEPTTQRARKRYVCDLCGEAIEPRATYTRWRWFNCGDVGTVRVHPACEDEAQDCDWYDDLDGWPEMYPLREERALRAEEADHG